MQTWLPVHVPDDQLASYRESARVLDDRRLRAQANEAKVILRVASGFTLDDNYLRIPWTGRGWANVALTRAWRPYTYQLALYGWYIAQEIDERWGNGRNARLWFAKMSAELTDGDAPPWLPVVAPRCRAQLLAKDPGWYGQFGWTEEPVTMRIWDDLEAAV